MSKSKISMLLILLLIIAAALGAYFYYDQSEPVIEQIIEPDVNEEIRGWWNESDVWRRIQIRNRKGWT